MMFFITFLRALAACIITNAHYVGIYPIDIIANGGLIGDVIFFAVSGYCLCNIKSSFIEWYGKRLLRCYLPVIICTLIYMILGYYTKNEHSIFWWFVYPTYYHFIASIILLYIPFYICMSIKIIKEKLVGLMIIIALIWYTVYILFYDKSFYHIDVVREPMIRFLFMESMFLGAWFKINDEKIRNKFKKNYIPITLLLLVTYFVSKMCFSVKSDFSQFQFVNQIVIFCLLFFIFLLVQGADRQLNCLPNWIKKCVNFISSITLEIYVVQYVLIDIIRPFKYFPLNWIIVTSMILFMAFLLHTLSNYLYNKIYNNILMRPTMKSQ